MVPGGTYSWLLKLPGCSVASNSTCPRSWSSSSSLPAKMSGLHVLMLPWCVRCLVFSAWRISVAFSVGDHWAGYIFGAVWRVVEVWVGLCLCVWCMVIRCLVWFLVGFGGWWARTRIPHYIHCISGDIAL